MTTEELESRRRLERYETILRVYLVAKKSGLKVRHRVLPIAREFGLTKREAIAIQSKLYNETVKLGPTSDDMIARQRIAA